MSKRTSQAELLFAAGLKLAGAPTWKREHQFHPERRWRFDFAWPGIFVAAEVEGGVFRGGRHQRPSGFIGDCEKYNTAAMMGWTVLRIPVAGKDWHIEGARMVADHIKLMRGEKE